MQRPQIQQFTGCLLGQCLGDALGFPVEGLDETAAARYVESDLRRRQTMPAPRAGYDPGQYTDDSQCARELLACCVEIGRFDPVAYAARIRELFASDRIVGPGLAMSEAARRLADGTAWEDSGARPPSAGNGTATRAAPIGLLYSDDEGRRNLAAVLQGWITHQDPRCSAGSIAIAGATALALHETRIDVDSFCESLAAGVDEFDEELAGGLRQLPVWVGLQPEEAVEYIARAGSGSYPKDGWRKISPFVTPSVLWSLYSFLRTPDDYWETICVAIEAGGDTDSTAAMAGALSGAHLGLEAVPSELAEQLHDRGAWRYEELVALAERAYRIRAESGATVSTS